MNIKKLSQQLMISIGLGLLFQPLSFAEPTKLPTAVQNFSKKLEKQPILISEFTQTKRVHGLNKPVISKGRLLTAHKQGIVWQINSPVKISYLLQQQKITEIRQDGSRVAREGNNTPALGQLGKSLASLMTLDPSGLSELYEITSNETANHWQLTLVPKQKDSPIKQVSLQGSQYVDQIQLDEVNGDQTTIAFSQYQQFVELPATDKHWFIK